MNIFYTKTYNMGGTNAVKQEIVEVSARKLGYDEISLFKFDDQSDSDEELKIRMEAITSPVTAGSTVIFQYPSMVGGRYDRFLTDALKKHQDLKLIFFVEDFGFEIYKEKYPDIESEIELLNRADLLILQSVQMKEYLKEHGLKEIPVIYQVMWDYPYEKVDNVIGSIEKKLEDIRDISEFQAIRRKTAGVCAVSNHNIGYENMCNPLVMGYCMALGIPVITQENTRAAQLVDQYSIGFICTVENDMHNIVKTIDDEKMLKIQQHIRNVRKMVQKGMFTRVLLEKTVFKVNENACIMR